MRSKAVVKPTFITVLTVCEVPEFLSCASPVLKNGKAVFQHIVRGDYWVPTNCSLTVNGGVASLIAWLDHSCQKTEVGGKQGHAPHRKILLQQIPMIRKNKQMTLSPWQFLYGQRV